MSATAPGVVVTGANGFVGARICETLVARDVPVRAVVRRAGTAPALGGVAELVGDFTDPGFAAMATAGARSVITTVHPMGSDRDTQHQIGVEGTLVVANAAVSAGVERLIHVSTAAVYDRSPRVGDVDESSALVGDDAGDYAVTKRDADRALGDLEGITRVTLRPPAILGPGPTSTWNTIRPAAMRDAAPARRANPEQTFAWVHVDDLASFAAELADGRSRDGSDPGRGPVAGECVAVNVAGGPATVRDYQEAVTGALGVEPEWEDGPVWRGRLLATRARAWGWTPAVDLGRALAEVVDGLRR